MPRASGSQSWGRPLTPQPLPGEGASGGTDHTRCRLLPEAQGPWEPPTPWASVSPAVAQAEQFLPTQE